MEAREEAGRRREDMEGRENYGNSMQRWRDSSHLDPGSLEC